MPGGREITGADVLAALRRAGAPRLDAPVGPTDAFASYEELARACPPARVGLTPGAHVAALAPLFGEFE